MKVRNVRTLTSINNASKESSSLWMISPNAKLILGRGDQKCNPSIFRTLYTTRILGDEVKVIVCPAFADSISEGDIR